MAWKPKKKAPELSYAEKQYVKMKLEEYKTKFFKPIKGQIIYKADGCNQEIVETARYYTEDELYADAKRIVDSMNKNDKEKRHWVLVSVDVIGRSKIEDESESNN